MVFVMSLFATAAVSDNRIALTNGASADDIRVSPGAVCIEVVLCSRKWDKENRVHVGSAPKVVPCQIPSHGRSPGRSPTSCQEVPLEKNTALAPATGARPSGLAG